MKHAITPFVAVLLFGLVGCEEREDPQYPQQPYPQPYPQTYPQPYPQPQTYPQPYPQTYPQPAAQPQPTMIPGVMKLPDGTCQATPPSLDPNTPAQPIAVPCPPQ